jgi:hypothetical protein
MVEPAVGELVRCCQMKRLLLCLVALSLSHALTQEGLLGNGEGLAGNPNAWDRFRETDLLEAMTASDLGLRGPVESVVNKLYWAEPGEEPYLTRLSLGPGRGGPAATRHLFDEHGFLRELWYLDTEGEVGAKYLYKFDEGTYRGYEYYLKVSGREPWTLRESVQRESVSSREEVVTVRSVHTAKSKDVHILYDEGGRPITEESFGPDGTFRNRTVYRYEDGRLVEQTDGTNFIRYEYYPEGSSPGQSLLVASRYFSSGDFQVVGRNGELIFQNSSHELLLQASTGYLYGPDGSLVEIRHSRPTYGQDGQGAELVTNLERYRGGLLVEELDFSYNVMTARVVHEYDESSRLMVSTELHYHQDGTTTGTRCDNIDFDEYGNWTTRRCTPPVDEAELQDVPDPFRGRVIMRAITYR